MSQPLRVLIVEDNENDVALLQHALCRAGYDITCEVVDTPAAMRASLKKQNWDLITSDHAMPHFSAPAALALAKELRPDVPFIIVSGEIDLKLAVSLMKGGVKDYIQKRELPLLIPAIERELREAKLRCELQQVDQALYESQEHLREVVENSLDAAYKRNLLTNTYDYFSPVITRIAGYNPEEMKSIPLDSMLSLIHPDDIAGLRQVKTAALSGAEGTAYQAEYRFKDKAGQYRWLQDRFSVTRAAGGSPQTLIGSVSDITERKLAEEALREIHENLRVHQIELEMQNEELRRTQDELDAERARYFDLWDLAPVGYLTISETGLILEANLTANNLLGVPRTLLARRPFSKFLLKEDQDSFYLHQRRLLETGEPQSYELRIVQGDDLTGGMWVNLEATIVQEETAASAEHRGLYERRKSPRRVIRIVLSDISERKQAEEVLRDSEEKYRTIADFTYDWEAWRAPDGTYRYISPSCERISDHTVAEFMADPHLLIKIAHPDDQSKVSEHYFPPDVEAQGQDSEFDFRILSAKGETRWISHCCRAVYGEDGRWLGRRESNRDITARKGIEKKIELLNANLDRLAHMDEMTGIHNRRSILLLAEHEFNVAIRYRPPLSILFFDIDFFKQINDTFGHAIGDQALKQIVQVACAEIRSADALGRYGGDEFIVLLPQTGVQEALLLAERIRGRIAALRMDTEKGSLTLTISIGIAQTIHMVLDPGDIPPDPADTAEKLIQRADQALYAAKQAGRNRTMIYDPKKTEQAEVTKLRRPG